MVKKNVKIWSRFFCSANLKPIPQTVSDIVSHPLTSCIFTKIADVLLQKNAQVQSGVSRLILSSRTLFEITCLGFSIAVLRWHNSVQVSFTGCSQTCQRKGKPYPKPNRQRKEIWFRHRCSALAELNSDTGKKPFVSKGLGHVICRTAQQKILPCLAHLLCAENDNRNVPNVGQNFLARQSRQHQIQQHQIGLCFR